MGQVKDSFSSIIEQKYDYNSSSSSTLDNNYLLYYDRLIQVACLATTIACNNDNNIIYLAQKLVYLHDHLNLILDSAQLLFFKAVKERLLIILKSQDKPAINKREFYILAIEVIIYCQSFNMTSTKDINSLARYIVSIRTNLINTKKFTMKEKILYKKFQVQYSYYLKRATTNAST